MSFIDFFFTNFCYLFLVVSLLEKVDARYKKIAQLAEMESTENTPNLLTVHLFEASGIQNTRGITTRDPYCILSVNG